MLLHSRFPGLDRRSLPPAALQSRTKFASASSLRRCLGQGSDRRGCAVLAAPSSLTCTPCKWCPSSRECRPAHQVGVVWRITLPDLGQLKARAGQPISRLRRLPGHPQPTTACPQPVHWGSLPIRASAQHQ
jgi:hypothetical protein